MRKHIRPDNDNDLKSMLWAYVVVTLIVSYILLTKTAGMP